MPIDMRVSGELEVRTSAWIPTELGSFSFGDERLSKRGLKLFECLAAQPQHSIPHAMGAWRDTKAAYRFLNNPKILYCFVHQTRKPPEKPPSLNEAIRLVARVGGFLGRKGDGQPGMTVRWRGLQGLTWISSAWLTFGPEAQAP